MSSRALLHTPWIFRNAISNFCRFRSQCPNVLHKDLSSHSTTRNKTKSNSESKSTVDQDEISQHAKMMSEWWNPFGPMKALHSYNLIRVPFIRDGLVDQSHEDSCTPLKDKKILDIGCGGGILSEPLAKLGAKVTGVDASCELIECAKKHSLDNPALANNLPNYICTSIEEHAKTNECIYDGVVASEIIEHVTNKELFIKSCLDTLKPGGRIFFTTPNRTKLVQFTVIYLAENVLNVLPKGTHQIEKMTTPVELTFMLERNECHVEAIFGIFYNVLTNRWSWIDNQSFAFALQAVKLK